MSGVLQDQYELIYSVVSAWLQCGSTSISVTDMPGYIQRLVAPSGDHGHTALHRQFTVSH